MKKFSNQLTKNVNIPEYTNNNNVTNKNSNIIDLNFSSRNPELFNLYKQLNGIPESINTINPINKERIDLIKDTNQEVENKKVNEFDILNKSYSNITNYENISKLNEGRESNINKNYEQKNIYNYLEENKDFPFIGNIKNTEENNYNYDIRYNQLNPNYNISYPNEYNNISYNNEYNNMSYNNEYNNMSYNNIPYQSSIKNINYNSNIEQINYNQYNQPNVSQNKVENYITNLIQNNQYTYYNNSKFNLVEIQEKNYNFILKKYNTSNELLNYKMKKELNTNKIPFLYFGFYKDSNDLGLMDWLKTAPHTLQNDKEISTYTLPPSENIHCIFYNNTHFITGTDIVKLILWYFNSTGCFISNLKKFEEGVFSDLRSLKVGLDSILESPRSKFLEFLYKKGCIRTQKKQKVFKYNSVNINKIYSDALERELRRGNGVFSTFCFPDYNFSKFNSQYTENKTKNIEINPKNLIDSKVLKPKNLDEIFLKKRNNEIKGNIFGISNDFSNLLSIDDEAPFFTDL